MGIDAVVLHVDLGSGDKERTGLMDRIKSLKINIAAIHDVDGAGLGCDQIEGQCITHFSVSRVTPFIHEASRNIRIFSVSCRSVMNFARESFFAGPMRNSGRVWRRAFATTNSDGGTPGRMVRSQEPNESQTSLGATTARYWSSPWATTPACMKA